ncbi:MAG: hypothetical protein ABSA18_13915 [Dehalococcoidia bacterium]|jgi:hypothetical protein
MSLVPAYVLASDDIRLLSSDTKIDFPNSLTFNVKADSGQKVRQKDAHPIEWTKDVVYPGQLKHKYADLFN